MPPKKDPNKPKGRMSAYAFFVKERRSTYKEQGKDVDFTAFSKECSSVWRSTNDDGKKKFSKLAEADKVRYDEDMSNYVPSEGYGGAKKGRGGGKKPRDPNKPKRPL